MNTNTINNFDESIELISPTVLEEATGISNPRFSKWAMEKMGFNRLNSLYRSHCNKDAFTFTGDILKEFNITLDIREEDLMNIPANGEFITVSNHPFGGWDGIILLHIMLNYRKDFKVVANQLLKKIKPLEDHIISVDPFEEKNGKNIIGIRKTLQELNNGTSLGIFPAGEVSAFSKGHKGISDKLWSKSMMKTIKKSEKTIVPVYFHGHNSWLFYGLGMIHPYLRTIKLPSELINKKDAKITIRIGKPISVKEQSKFEKINDYSRFLRLMTYSLGSNIDTKKLNFIPRRKKEISQAEIIQPISTEALITELSRIQNDKLFDYKQFSVYCVEGKKTPSILTEISRLRELTFRTVGEGTNRSQDLDAFDLYYKQLFIWDNEKNKIVGGYRLGDGREIYNQLNKGGFYINSLFKIKAKFRTILRSSLELGRSFVVEEYQKSPQSLFLLWKGVLYYLLGNKKFKYLIGPVSISNSYSQDSKAAIIAYLNKYYQDEKLSQLIKPKKPFKPKNSQIVSMVEDIPKGEINLLDKVILNIEKDSKKTPVLIKKYLSLNAKFLSFNVDSDFNNALDGFLIVRINDIDKKIIQNLAKEIEADKLSLVEEIK